MWHVESHDSIETFLRGFHERCDQARMPDCQRVAALEHECLTLLEKPPPAAPRVLLQWAELFVSRERS